MRVVRNSGVVRNRQNPLTDGEARGLTAGPKLLTHALGESLFLVVEPTNRFNRKCLVGRNRQLLAIKGIVAFEVTTIQYLQKF